MLRPPIEAAAAGRTSLHGPNANTNAAARASSDAQSKRLKLAKRVLGQFRHVRHDASQPAGQPGMGALGACCVEDGVCDMCSECRLWEGVGGIDERDETRQCKAGQSCQRIDGNARTVALQSLRGQEQALVWVDEKFYLEGWWVGGCVQGRAGTQGRGRQPMGTFVVEHLEGGPILAPPPVLHQAGPHCCCVHASTGTAYIPPNIHGPMASMVAESRG